jgi:hypothetical protein
MTNVPTILALDASSTMIGWCVYAGDVLAHGEHKLAGGDIATRCQTAYDILVLLLKRFPAVDAVAIESPVARFAKRRDPPGPGERCAAAGGCAEHKLYIEIIACGCQEDTGWQGQCRQALMQAKAAERGVSGEHASDALGIALAAYKRIEVVLV